MLFPASLFRCFALLLTWPNPGLVSVEPTAAFGDSGSKSVSTNWHPTHVTMGEFEYNEDTQSLECALCLFQEDVRAVLHRLTDQVIDLENNDRIDPLLQQYVRENFWVATTDRQECPLQWLGYEVEGQHLWVYFQVPLAAEPTNLLLGHRMFMEIQPGNIAAFQFKWGWRRATLQFNLESQARRLDWTVRREVKFAAANPWMPIPRRDAPPQPTL